MTAPAHIPSSQAHISQHLMALREAGMIISFREGRYGYYRLSDPRLLEFIRPGASLAGLPAESSTLGAISPAADRPCPQCETAGPEAFDLQMEVTDANDLLG